MVRLHAVAFDVSLEQIDLQAHLANAVFDDVADGHNTDDFARFKHRQMVEIARRYEPRARLNRVGKLHPHLLGVKAS